MEEKIINGIKYRLDKDTLTAEVVWNDDEYSGNIVIPDTIVSDTVSYKVTSIGDAAFARCTSLISIIIPDSVTSIGSDVFRSCTSLTSVIIGNSVISIGNSTFYNCKSLTNITIPNKVTSIGDFAFSWCQSLKSITTPDEWMEKALSVPEIHSRRETAQIFTLKRIVAVAACFVLVCVMSIPVYMFSRVRSRSCFFS